MLRVIIKGLGYEVDSDHDRPLLNRSAILDNLCFELVLGEPEWVQHGGDDSHQLVADWSVAASGRRFSAFWQSKMFGCGPQLTLGYSRQFDQLPLSLFPPP